MFLGGCGYPNPATLLQPSIDRRTVTTEYLRRKKGAKRWRQIPEDEFPSAVEDLDPNYEYKFRRDIDKEALRNWFTWIKLEDHPRPGYTTSVRYEQTTAGWRLTDVAVSMSQIPNDPFGSATVAPWLYNGVALKDLNEEGITSRILHDVRIGRINSEVVEHLAAGTDLNWAFEELKKTLTPSRRQEHTDQFKASLARAYVQAVKENPRGAHERIAEVINYSPKTVREYIKRIREEGWITEPPKRGTAGGELTTKAMKVLYQMERDAVPQGPHQVVTIDLQNYPAPHEPDPFAERVTEAETE